MSANVAGAGVTSTVTVTVATGCAWTATSNAAWITITAGNSGSGNGSVSYAVAANTDTASRTGTLTIGGKTFTVMQAGATCAPTISPGSANVAAAGATGSVSRDGVRWLRLDGDEQRGMDHDQRGRQWQR